MVLDITNADLAYDLCGGICSAGSNRVIAAVLMGIPHVAVSGCGYCQYCPA